MADESKIYLNVVLNDAENELLLKGKELSGIRGSADFVRFLIAQYAKEEE